MRCIASLTVGGYRVEGGLVCRACGNQIGLPSGDTITWAQFKLCFPAGVRCAYCGKWIAAEAPRAANAVVVPAPRIAVPRHSLPRYFSPGVRDDGNTFASTSTQRVVFWEDWSPWTLVRIAAIGSAIFSIPCKPARRVIMKRQPRGKRAKRKVTEAEPITVTDRVRTWLESRGIPDAEARVARLNATEQAVIAALLDNPFQSASPETRHALFLLGSLAVEQRRAQATSDERLAAYNRILRGEAANP